MRRMGAAARVTVARQLALAAATGEVLDAMSEAGIRTVMLKGAAIATRLYDNPELRPAGDVDLLVAPSQARAAAQVLTRLGFHDPLAGARAHERSAHAVTFRREGTSPACVDLHTALPLCRRDPEALWDEFSRGTTAVHIAGRPIEVLADHAQALRDRRPRTTAWWSAQAARGSGEGGRAVRPRNVGATAAMARRLGAEGVLAAGCDFRTPGLGWRMDSRSQSTDDSVEIRLRQAGSPQVAFGLMRLAETRSVRQRLQLVLRELIPTRPFMRIAYPFAARGPAALTLAYLYRPVWLAVRFPRAVTEWRRATTAGGLAPGEQVAMSRVSALTPGNADRSSLGVACREPCASTAEGWRAAGFGAPTAAGAGDVAGRRHCPAPPEPDLPRTHGSAAALAQRPWLAARPDRRRGHER